jgi:hypothetical protein
VIDADSEQATAPYASGGGGTVLEHLYAAVLLSSLLTGDPITELGDDATPVSVRFQGRTLSAVDDLIVSGSARGEERRVSIGVRRAPDLTKSDKKTARLLAAYVQMVAEHWEDIRAGRWRLYLAVAAPSPVITQLRELTLVAGAATDVAAFLVGFVELLRQADTAACHETEWRDRIPRVAPARPASATSPRRRSAPPSAAADVYHIL